MATSDFPNESDQAPEAAPPAEPPRIVNLPSSFDMTEFPSEMSAFLSETADDAETPAMPAAASPPVAASSTAPPEESPAATVIEFPAHPVEPAPAHVDATPIAPAYGRTLTLADILEERGGLDWRESVALTRSLCEQLKRRSQRTPVLLEARNIEVTPTGEVALLSEQLGGDPIVMQLGRLLRTMLMGRPAPPELRLLLAQATFELPIFDSVDDVDRALAQIERLEDMKPPPSEIVPFTAPALTRPALVNTNLTVEKPTAAVRPIKPPSQPRRIRPRIPPIDWFLWTYGARMVAGLAAIIAVVALFIAGPSLVIPQQQAAANPERPSVVVRPPAATTGTDTEAGSAVAARPGATASNNPSLSDPRPTSGGEIERGTARSSIREPHAPAAPRNRTAAAPERAPLVTPSAAIVPPAVSRESERRASELIAQGQPAEAAIVFDSLLLSNPLYEPKASDISPESMAAFRNSQKLLLPVLAQRGYDRAKSALAAGDVDRALSSARETAAILDRPAAEPAAHLRDDVERILDEAGAAKAAADEVVYTRADTGVAPPRPLSRQFPATTPNGVPAHRVGTLEMIIGKDGTVEFVKLHTPLNRYHERMIVSAAKAWLYRPATKAGKPVRFRLTVTINLPENGTY
jgi:hypothetical protein